MLLVSVTAERLTEELALLFEEGHLLFTPPHLGF